MNLENELNFAEFKNQLHKVGINLTYTSSWASQWFRNFYQEFDFTLQQYHVLRILKEHFPQPLSTSDIQRRMLDRMSDTSRIVGRLTKKNLASRKPNSVDKRLVDVLITQEGLTLYKQIERREMELFEIFKNLSWEEAKQLNMLLDKMRGADAHLNLNK